MSEVRLEIYTWYTTLAIRLSAYQKLLKLMDIWRSSDTNRLCSLFWDTVYVHGISSTKLKAAYSPGACNSQPRPHYYMAIFYYHIPPRPSYYASRIPLLPLKSTAFYGSSSIKPTFYCSPLKNSTINCLASCFVSVYSSFSPTIGSKYRLTRISV